MSHGQGPITIEQLELLLDFLDDHRDLAQGRLRAFDSREKAKKLWEEITSNLNSISGGSIKTVQQWQKVWADRKHLAKKNAVANTIAAASKDGEPSSRGPLSQSEVRILDILGDSFEEAHHASAHKFDEDDSSDSISEPVTSRRRSSKRQSLRETSSKPALSPTWLGPSHNIAAQNSQSPLTIEQLDILLDFMDEHRALARGRLKGKDYKLEARRLWEEISNMLNSVVGSFKTVTQWQKVWADRKHLAKKNAAAKSADDTVPLSQTELRILSIVGDSSGELQTKREPANSHDSDLEEASDSQPSHSQTLPQTSSTEMTEEITLTVPLPLEETMVEGYEDENCTRGQHTAEQLNLLLDFMDKHRDLARGSLRSEEALVKANQLWAELTELLNSIDGCVKSILQWKKVWADRKHLAKKKAMANKKYATAADTRLLDLAPLLEWEQKILDILGISYEIQTTFENFDDDGDDELSSHSFSSHRSRSSQPQVQASTVTADNSMANIPEADSGELNMHFEEEKIYSYASDVTMNVGTEEESHFQARTTEQLDSLLDFMDEHRDLARGRLRNAKGRVKAKRLWDEVTHTLNSLQGSVKTVEQWQKVWADKKHLAKKNAVAKRITAASGGPSDGVPLTEWEQRILSIVGENIGEPLTFAPPSPQNYDSEDKLASDYISSQYSQSQELPQTAIEAENGIVIIPEVIIDFKEEHHSQESHMTADTHFEEYPPTTSSQPLPLTPDSAEPLALPQNSQNDEDDNTNQAITTEQLYSLLDFMDAHRDLARGRLRNVKGRVKAKQLWQQITNTLNSYHHGSVKTIPQWQKVWTDRKHLAKKNAKKNSAAAASGGPSDEVPLTEWDLKILSIVSEDIEEPLTMATAPPQNLDSEEDLASDSYSSQHSQSQNLSPTSSNNIALNSIEFIAVDETSDILTRKTEFKTINKCRVCLKDGAISIFREDISKYITICTGILIKRNDDLPKYICYKCYELLQSAILFRKTAQHTNLLLKRKRKLALKRLKQKSCTEKYIEINVESFEESKKLKAECETKNVSLKREPTSEEDENEAYENDFENVGAGKEEQASGGILSKEKLSKCVSAKKPYDCIEHTNIHNQLEDNFKTAKEIDKQFLIANIPECRGKYKGSVNESDSYIEMKKTKHESQSIEIDERYEIDSEAKTRLRWCNYEHDYFDTVGENKVARYQSIKKQKLNECKTSKKSSCIERMKIRKNIVAKSKKRKRSKEEGPCICETCGKVLTSQRSLEGHMLTHKNVFPFKCTLCPYRGRTKDLLNSHVKVHTGDYPHKCKYCPYSFVNTSNLYKHMRRHFGFTFFCKNCKKGCYTKADLEKHVRVKHLRIMDYKCNTCGRKFGYPDALAAHQRKFHRKKADLKLRPLYLQSENNTENLTTK